MSENRELLNRVRELEREVSALREHVGPMIVPEGRHTSRIVAVEERRSRLGRTLYSVELALSNDEPFNRKVWLTLALDTPVHVDVVHREYTKGKKFATATALHWGGSECLSSQDS